MSLGAIDSARLGRVYFAGNRQEAAQADFNDCFINDEISVALAKSLIPILHLKHSDSLKPFSTWTAQPDKINFHCSTDFY